MKSQVKQQQQALTCWVDEAESMIGELAEKQRGLERWAGDYQVSDGNEKMMVGEYDVVLGEYDGNERMIVGEK